MAFLYQKGDGILTKAQNGNWVSKIIIWGDTSSTESEGLVSHAAMIINDTDDFDEVMIIEATMPKVKISYLSEYRGSVIYHFRNLLITSGQRKLMVQYAMTLFNDYGMGKIGLFATDVLLSKFFSWVKLGVGSLLKKKWKAVEVRWFSNIDLFKSYVCSQLLARIYQIIALIKLGGNWRTRTPDDIFDHVRDDKSFVLKKLRIT